MRTLKRAGWAAVGALAAASTGCDWQSLPAEFASLDGESVEARIARRLTRWTPMTLMEPEERP